MEFVKSTAILTEHLGYAPIALIDDVINAVNDILYKCTAAMETFLVERYQNDESIPADEIEMGTAKLETLLESVVDRCFDKFELYVLRNLLIIPPELISGGWMRLEHQQGVDFASKDSLTTKIVELRTELYHQKHLNYLLKTRSKRTAKLLAMLDGYRTSLQFLKPAELNDVAPLHETIQFLASQITEMITKIEQTQEQDIGRQRLDPGSERGTSRSRDQYVDTFSRRAVESVGLQQDTTSATVIQQQASQAQKLAEEFE